MTAVQRYLPTAHSTPTDWLWLVVPVAVLIVAVSCLVAFGRAPGRRGPAALVARAAGTLRRMSLLPAWCTGGLAMATWALVVAVIGFVWDVAWHIDFGRDRQLYTPPHVMILTGLLGIGVAGLVSITLASVERKETSWRLGPFRLPSSAVALGMLSIGAGLGFPLDDLWHHAYGIDVTMWSPTHLLMIGGASFAPIALWLMYAEAGGPALSSKAQRWMRHALAALVVVGLSTFQLEFDLGVPQWRALHQPVLIAAATSIGLVAARVALGRGGALRAAAGFLLVRAALALVVGGVLGLAVPHFPLYLGGALAIEMAFEVGKRLGPLPLATLAGSSCAVFGLATEWGFSHLFGREPWQSSLLSGMWVAVAAGITGAILGVAMGRVLSMRDTGMRAPVVALAGLALAGSLVVPLPRQGTPATATIWTQPASTAVAVVDADGEASFEQLVDVTVSLSPADTAQDADWFVIQSWQGGGSRSTSLREVALGVYRGTRSVPTGGSWKTIVFLQKGAVVAGAPVAMPADRQYGLAAIQVLPERTAAMVPASMLFMREVHGGPAWPFVVAYTGLGLTVIAWITGLVLAFVVVRRRTAIIWAHTNVDAGS